MSSYFGLLRPYPLARVVLLLASLSATFSFGQGIVTGNVSGTVQDPQGAVVNGAKVTAVQGSTNISQTTTTSAGGGFTLRNLPVGTYSITIEAPGFAPLSLSAISVDAGTTVGLGTQKLSVTAAEVVNVEATVPLIESTTSQATTVFGAQQVTDLPVGNGFDSLALLAPGVANVHDNGFSNTNGAGISVNGQRGRSNNFEIDGQNNNDNSVGGSAFLFGNQDAVQEVQVVTNNFSAEYGRNLGSVVNYVTKAGTNSFHGTAFEFYNGSFLSSLSNDQKSATFGFCGPNQSPATDGCSAVKRPRDTDNRYGATIGGPIIKNKLWFFGSTNYERNFSGVAPATSTTLTPTPTGLSQLAAAFPGNHAVTALQNSGPFAIAVGNPIVSGAPTTLIENGVPIQFGKVQRSVAPSNLDKEITGRVDYQLGEKDHIFGRYLYQSTLSTGSFAGNTATQLAEGAFTDTAARNQSVGLDWTRLWSSNFVNQVRLSYFRENLGFEGGAQPDCVRNTINDCSASVAIRGGFFGFGYATNLPQGRLVNNTQYQDNATLQKGQHSLKFGGEYDRQRSPNSFLPNVNGGFIFTNFSSFLNGVGTLNLGDGNVTSNFKEQDIAAYFEDDWKVTHNLTLNLGLRWEFYQQALNLLNDETVARESDPATAFFNTALPLSARTFPSLPQNTRNFEPNIGFAWAPHLSLLGSHSTVIRGGYRINYDPAFYNIFLNAATSAPVVNLGSIACTAAAPCLPSAGIAGNDVRALNLARLPRGGNPNALNETTVSQPFLNPYAQNYSLGIQQEITSKIVAEVRYSGNHTIHQFQTVDANPQVDALVAAFPNLLPTGDTVCATPGSPGIGRLSCNNSNIRSRENTAFSFYNGLQTRLDIRDYRGVTAGVSYTWAHSTDNASEIFSTGAAGNTVTAAPNPFNFTGQERANSGLDYPNVLSLYMSYRLPFFNSASGWKQKVLGGWEINNIYEFNSGQPESVAQFTDGSLCDTSFNNAFLGGFDSCRPFFLGGDRLNPFSYAVNTGPGSTDFKGNPVAQSSTNPFGASRNTVRGQSFNNLDTSVYKNAKITERYTLQLQATVFNILNRQYRGGLDPFIDDEVTTPAGGIDPVLSTFLNTNGNTSNNRNVTLGAKIIF